MRLFGGNLQVFRFLMGTKLMQNRQYMVRFRGFIQKFMICLISKEGHQDRTGTENRGKSSGWRSWGRTSVQEGQREAEAIDRQRFFSAAIPNPGICLLPGRSRPGEGEREGGMQQRNQEEWNSFISDLTADFFILEDRGEINR